MDKDKPIGIKIWLWYNILVTLALIMLFLIELFTDTTLIQQLYGLSKTISYAVPIFALILGLAIIYGYWFNGKVLYYSSLSYCSFLAILSIIFLITSSFSFSHIISIIIFLIIGYYFYKRKSLME